MNIQTAAVNQPRNIKSHQKRHIEFIREVGKADRLALTDAIKEFVKYVDQNGKGASRPDLAYINFTRTIYAPFGLNAKQRNAKEFSLEARDTFEQTELSYLQVAERTAAEVLYAGMKRGDTRRAIKTSVRDIVRQLSAILKSVRNIQGVK